MLDKKHEQLKQKEQTNIKPRKDYDWLKNKKDDLFKQLAVDPENPDKIISERD